MALNTSKEADETIESIHPRVGAETKAVLGRSAICLALAEGVPSDFKAPAALGKSLSSDALFGELEPVIRAALNFRAGKTLSEAQQTHELRRHFEWGCQLMRRIWEDEVGRDQGKFIVELLRRSKISGEARSPGAAPTSAVKSKAVVETEVKLKLLTDAEPWSLNGPGTNNGLLVVSGAPGSGKSQLALDILAQLSGQGVRFVFFDLKGELEDEPNNERQQATRKKFLSQTNASYVRLIRDELPINPLWRDSSETINNQSAYEIASLFSAFVPQLGAKQVGQLVEAYQAMERPDFTNWLVELEKLGGTGVHRETLKRICDVNLFATAETAVPLEQWLARSLVIDFKQFGNDDVTKSLAVALILNLLMKRLNTQLSPKDGVQPLKMVLFVDEAHLLLPKEGKIGLLGSLARQGRSWGFPVWLASQDADAFETSGDKAVDFAELAECGIHLTPQTLSPAGQKRVLGETLPRALKKGEAAVKIAGTLSLGKARQYHRDGGI
ncbi:MAG: DndE family protein [Undibacterium sp.]|nr:DndE family protein [Opitutaceae bacterium]